MFGARVVALTCWLACAALPGAVSAQFFDHSYAIVIGIDQYEHSDLNKPLSYAVKDAQAMADLLRAQGYTVVPLYGSDATKGAILTAVEDNLAPKLRAGDRVLVFFAGHGKAEELGGRKRGYIVPYDGSTRSTLISMEELEDLSSYMGSARHQLFIMDSCYGGLLAATRDSLVDPSVADYLKEVTGRIARQVLTAGGRDQEVLDSGPNGHSYFMEALLEGLRDGLADRSGSGYITFAEVVAYVTPRASNRYQTPGSGVLPGHQEGEFLFRNPKGSGRPVAAIPTPFNPARRGGETKMSAEQYVALGDARLGVSDWDGAGAQYREAIRVDPNDAEAHYDLGIVLDKKGDWEGEIREEGEAIRLKPNHAEAHASLGVALDRKGDSDGEILEEREAIRLKPDLPEAHANLGAALGEKEDWDGEIREEREAIRLKPDFPEAHGNLGNALISKEDWDGGIQEEREAIRLKPDAPAAYFNLGWALEHKGDIQSALAEYRRALELEPGDKIDQDSYDRLLRKINGSAK